MTERPRSMLDTSFCAMNGHPVTGRQAVFEGAGGKIRVVCLRCGYSEEVR